MEILCGMVLGGFLLVVAVRDVLVEQFKEIKKWN